MSDYVKPASDAVSALRRATKKSKGEIAHDA